MRTVHLTKTSTGLQIGCAYIAPPQHLGSQAERIQHLLLSQPRAPGIGDYLAAACALLCIRVAGAFSDSDLIALYRLHRSKRAGRWQSIRGALRCWSPF